MNVKKQIMRAGWVALLAAFLVASTPAFAIESSPIQLAHARAAAIPQSGGSYTKSIWSISNQFGSGRAWLVNTPTGSSVFHLSFSSLSGGTVDETVAPGQIKVVYGAGSFEIDNLANGHKVMHVFVKPGACESQPGNMTAVTGATASTELDGHGNPVNALQNGRFYSTRKALACRTASVGSELRTFMAQAGMPLPAAVPSLPVAPGQVRTEISGGCALAAGELALATAALAAAIAAAGGTAGLGSPAVLAAWAAYVWASMDYERACVSAE